MHVDHIVWAKQHDWYRGCRLMPNGKFEVTAVEVITLYMDGQPVTSTDLKTFTDFQELTQWAGY